MDSALSELETKINQLVATTNQLRSENQLLRKQLASKSEENKRLTEKIETAKLRLNALLQQLPEGES